MSTAPISLKPFSPPCVLRKRSINSLETESACRAHPISATGVTRPTCHHSSQMNYLPQAATEQPHQGELQHPSVRGAVAVMYPVHHYYLYATCLIREESSLYPRLHGFGHHLYAMHAMRCTCHNVCRSKNRRAIPFHHVSITMLPSSRQSHTLLHTRSRDSLAQM